MSLVYKCNRCDHEVSAMDKPMQRGWVEIRTYEVATLFSNDSIEKRDIKGHLCPECYKSMTDFLTQAVNQ